MASWQELANASSSSDGEQCAFAGGTGPPQSADAVATGGWDAILEREATSSAGFHAPEAEPADGQVIPSIDLSAAGQHKARLRGRRSALLVEALKEHSGGEPAKPPRSRAEICEQARQAKAAKAAKADQPQSRLAGSLAIVPRGSHHEVLKQLVLPESMLVAVGRRASQPFDSSPLGPLALQLTQVRQTDERTAALVTNLCRQPNQQLVSATVRAHHLQVDRKTLCQFLPRVGSAIVTLDHAYMRRLELAISRADVELILYIDSAAYDETPMLTATPEVQYDYQAGEPKGVDTGSSEVLAESPVLRVKRVVVGSGSATAKIFQCTSDLGLLIKSKRPIEPGQNPYTFVIAHTLTWLQFLETSSSEVLREALQSVSPVSTAANAFQAKVRLTASDRLAANLKAEKKLVEDRGDGWLSLSSPCDVHIVAGAQTKSLALIADFVSSMVHLSLSLRLSGMMRRFRACVRGVVARMLKIMHGTPPPEAERYRAFCLDLFLSRGSHSARRRVLLLMWLNGDWRDTTHIQHYVQASSPAAERSPAYLCRMVSRAVLQALASKMPSVFPRTRWTKADTATDELGLLMCCHGILFHAYMAFLVSCGHRGARDIVQPSVGGRGPRVVQDGHQLAIGAGDGEDDEGESEVDFGEAPPDHPGQPQRDEAVAGLLDVPGEDQTDWAAWNAKFRQGGFRFLMSAPLGMLMLLRLCLEPFRVIMQAHLHMASAAWETEQRHREAKAMQGDSGNHRQYRVVVAASQTLEDQFLVSVYDLLCSKATWAFLPLASCTFAFKCLAFRMLSRMGSCVQYMLKLPHSRFPFKLFLLLEDPSLSEVFACAKPCELDDFSKGFLETFREKGLSHPDALMALQCLALLMKVDISGIEARHASIRRLLHRTPQAPAFADSQLSATWVCTQFAKRQLACRAKGVIKGRLKKPSGAKLQPKSIKHRRGKRSAWQAFVHEVSQGSKANFKDLHKAYQELSHDELQRLRDKAARACRPNRLRASSNAFGMTVAKAVSRVRAKKQKQLWLRRSPGVDDGSKLRALCQSVYADKLSHSEALERAGRETRFEQARLRALHQEQEDALMSFSSGAGNAPLLEAMRDLQVTPEQAPSFTSFPAQGLTAVEFAPDVGTAAESLLSLAKQHHLSSNFSAALTMDWQSKIDTIMHAGLPPIPDTSREQKQADLCRLAGVCLCSPEGKVLKSFCFKLLAALKPLTRWLTPARTWLMEGELVLVLQFVPLPASGQDGLQAVLDTPPDFTLPGDGQHWLHIGLMYLRPYRPTFQLLTRSERAPSVQGSVSLDSTGVFETFFPSMGEMNLDRSCWMGLFKIWGPRQTTGSFVPGQLTARQVVEPVLFWFGPGRRRVRRKGAPANANMPGPDSQAGDDTLLGPGQWVQVVDGGVDDEFDDEDAPEAEVAAEEEAAVEQEIIDDLLWHMFGQEGEQVEPGDLKASRRAQQPITPDWFSETPSPFNPDEGENEPPPSPPGGAPAPFAPPGSAMAADSWPPPVPQLPGAASSSSAAPPRLDHSLASVDLHGGKIAYYPDKGLASKGRFQATCGQKDKHGPRCRLTRTSNVAANPNSKPAQGRPLGLMAAWLGAAEAADTFEEHAASVGFLDFHQRSLARQELELAPGSQDLLDCERPQRGDEGPEPVGLP